MEEILFSILDFISTIPVIVILLFVFFVGMYVFWRGCVETNKNRSSIFDVYILSLLFSLFVGRLAYILSNMSEFSNFIWYWSPYEKYADTVYVFRLLPWRFLRIWDGGIVIFGMFVGFLVFASLFTIIIKRWRWRQMFFVIFFPALLILSLSLLYVSAISSDLTVLLFSTILFTISLLFYISSYVITRLKINWIRRRKMVAYIGVVLVSIASAYTSYKFITESESNAELISAYVLGIWLLLSVVLFVLDMRKKKSNIKKLSSVQSVSLPEINQPIRLPSNEEKK